MEVSKSVILVISCLLGSSVVFGRDPHYRSQEWDTATTQLETFVGQDQKTTNKAFKFLGQRTPQSPNTSSQRFEPVSRESHANGFNYHKQPAHITEAMLDTAYLVLRRNRKLFKIDDDQVLYQKWANTSIRVANPTSPFATLPQDSLLFNVEFANSRGVVDRFTFMLQAGWLIPLGTHVNRTLMKGVKAYQINDTGLLISDISLPEYILTRLPNDVVLTRVLGKEELDKWKQQDRAGLGSRHDRFWRAGDIHTAFLSITDEFQDNEGHPFAIKFIVNKEEIRTLLAKDMATLGTYDDWFRNRVKSPFSFDFEIIVNGPEAIAVLIKGYQQWVKNEGEEQLMNPFAK